MMRLYTRATISTCGGGFGILMAIAHLRGWI